MRLAFAVVSMSGILSWSNSGPFGLGIPRRMGFVMFESVGTQTLRFIVSILVIANTCVMFSRQVEIILNSSYIVSDGDVRLVF
jgi:hypothetical protein